MLNKDDEKKLSKFMSFILRHQPEKFKIKLDSEGYCEIDSLIEAINVQSKMDVVTKENILQVVKNCPKQRYEINEKLIRARYGHSTKKIEYEQKIPPSILYHGTYTEVIDLIKSSGIKSMNRKYVHLSESKDFATLAGQRKGELVILKIDTTQAIKDGVIFYYAGNEVWLTEYIAPKYILS